MTPTVLTIRGRDFTATPYARTVSAGPRAGQSETLYTLVGKRGATFGTMRNAHNPHLLFCYAAGKTNALEGVWLSDESGSLRVVSP